MKIALVAHDGKKADMVDSNVDKVLCSYCTMRTTNIKMK